ncbi:MULTISPECIES: PDR/VanB family oxidoreductase [Nocardioides]|uniref:PDR/VanB family oxidoreductase n=1 Tax=Nocardioides vastitatis TaxID=2568655 RepID=A0ABW0ZPP6_9ACTN|nr:PDR/VanB family oxidoreductase [Nocardioides sp.]THJ05788.1 oxidoreductase [Nocardioides sp.]
MTSSTDRTSDRTSDPATDLLIAAYRGYLRVFAQGRLANHLSPAAPVRRAGFDIDVTVVDRTLVAEDVVSITLARPDGTALPAWTPGAHLDVFLPSGLQRQYSLCGDPADRSSYRIAVRRVAGGSGSHEVHDQLEVGDPLTVRGPRNAFLLVPERSYLFVAAGIGITPILPMVTRAEASGAAWRLVYLGRSRATMPFLDDLELYGDRVVVRTDDEHGVPSAEGVLALGRTGEAPLPPAVYLCGPPPLIDAARTLVRPLAPHSRLFSERFSAPPVRGGEPFSVTLARSGRLVQVAEDESLLTVLRREVPGVAYSCQQGFCGTCKVRVLSGEIDHRDKLLLPAEREELLLACSSRGRGPLVLDL